MLVNVDLNIVIWLLKVEYSIFLCDIHHISFYHSLTFEISLLNEY